MRYAPYEFKRQDAFDFSQFVHIKAFERGDELHFLQCPYCRDTTKDKKTFAINLTNGTFKCLRASCGVSGNMIRLSQDFGFSLGNEIDNYFEPKKQKKKFKKPDKPIEPKAPAIEYLQSRGISEATAKVYEITTQTGRDNILVFPFYADNGDLNFIKYRKTDFDKTKDHNKEWCQTDGTPILFGMNHCNFDNKTLIITEGQCFDGKAEVLTPEGWIRLEEYGGQNVLQVDQNMNGSFVRPKQYIVKRHIGKMVKVEIGGNYETYTTDDHNLVFIDNKKRVLKKQAIEKISTAYHIPTAINFNSLEHKQWTNDMFALYIAVSADGTIDFRKNNYYNKAKSERYVRIAIPLQRKIDRFREILNNLHIEFTDNKDCRGYQSICFHCPEWLKSKFLPYWFATETTVEQKKFIIEEMVKWDGNKVNGKNQYEYTSILKHNADVIQLVATMCGYMSTIMSKQNGGNGNFTKGYCYKVSILLGKHNVSTQQFEKHKIVTEVDQRVYCVTVDTGMILVRQNNKISVSGNCDSLSVSTCGIENAVSVPTGAKGFTWVPNCWDFVNKFDTIIVFGDHENGKITLLEEIRQRFRQHRVKHVRFEDYKDCKDANDILRKYGKEQIKACIDNAVDVPINHVREVADVEDINPFDIEKQKTGFKDLDTMLYGGLPFGCVTVVTGKSGLGKSTLASQILLNAIENNHKVFAYSGELPNHNFKSWLTYQAAGAEHIITYDTKWGEKGYNVSDNNKKLISEWFREKIYVYDDRSIESDELIDLIKIIESVIVRLGCDVILVDNLMTAIDLSQVDNTDKYERQSKFVKELTTIARRFNVLIILVAHMRKNSFGGNGNDEVGGSSDITNLASVTLMIDKDKEDDEIRLLKCWKNRLFGKVNTEGWRIDYDEKSKRLYGTNDNVNKRYSWDNVFIDLPEGADSPFD